MLVFQKNVVAVAATDRIALRYDEEVLIPKGKDAFGKLRVYYEISPDFVGIDASAAWEDFALGMEHIRDWERIAVVTDVEWIRLAIKALQFLMLGMVCVFDLFETATARRKRRGPGHYELM